jgi:hypothetical protein
MSLWFKICWQWMQGRSSVQPDMKTKLISQSDDLCYCWGGVRWSLPMLGQLCQFQVINGQNYSISGIILDGKTIIVREKPVSSATLCSTNAAWIGLEWNPCLCCVIWWLTAWAMAQSNDPNEAQCADHSLASCRITLAVFYPRGNECVCSG